MNRLRWDPCIYHNGTETVEFIRDFFAEPQRQVLLVGAAGFDARSTCVAELLHEAAEGRVRGVFIREERPDPSRDLLARAERHERHLSDWFPGCQVRFVDVFDTSDQAVVAGVRTIRVLNEVCTLDEITDVVVDVSALSACISFPMVRYILEQVRDWRHGQKAINVHVMLASDVFMDEGLDCEFMDKVTTVLGFNGRLGLVAERERTTRLWIPQLSRGKRVALQRVYRYLQDLAPLLDVCPLLPFPGRNPRRTDDLIVEYRDELEESWAVDERNLLYVAEDDPLDVYRAIVHLFYEREEVFRAIGPSEIVLSPVGHKATAFGCLMAAMELNLPVLYVEALRFKPPAEVLPVQGDLNIIHLWLSGDVYAPDPVR